MRYVDLFCGKKGASAEAVARGHDVLTLDFDPRFDPDVCADILTVTAEDIIRWCGGRPHFIWASPPCECFSVGSIGRHWHHDHSPKTDEARQAIGVLEATVALIQEVDPDFWIIENPDGKMKRMPVMWPLDLQVIDYCQYGDIAQKRTCLWGGFPQSWRPRRRCRATGAPVVEHLGVDYRIDRVTGRPCHEKASRGDKSGTQGKGDSAARAVVPSDLIRDLLVAAEADLGVSVGSGRASLF